MTLSMIAAAAMLSTMVQAGPSGADSARTGSAAGAVADRMFVTVAGVCTNGARADRTAAALAVSALNESDEASAFAAAQASRMRQISC